ncbi:TetR/AcrR family transcriptional regulator [Actinomadura rupiterrae]|uniref:TetR/AcrR family transcriptional regulator n=1 Tax=Actinomadura rupiterrae TaxID=559627 RepID=UPI0020A45BE7|nr:TetR/AcrR family transcriptional regulator [Actinomadura rupiterrae]MCP2341595.1 AcrR family transcriptional regulator [Actinomadura rupiterrae]
MSRGDPATRARILDAARELLEEAPGAPISMGEVARRAQVSRQALYLHFEDRATLLLEVARAADAAARTPREQARIDDAPDGLSALREAVALQSRLKPRLHGIATALDVLRRSDDAAEAAWREREEGRLRRCEQVVARLAAENRLAERWSVEDAARLMWALTAQHAWEDLAWPADRYTEQVTALLERALLR